MSPKKIFSYFLLAISALLVLKILLGRKEPPAPGSDQTTSEQHTYPTPSLPIAYTIGTVDSRFGISKERVSELAEEARKLWEDAAGRELIRFEEGADLKVNLVYDWRQEKLLAALEARSTLDESGKSFDVLQADYDEKLKSYERSRIELEEVAEGFRSRLSEYNARVARWNEGGERTESERSFLLTRKSELDREQAEIENKRTDLKDRAAGLNKLAESLNNMAREHNLDVENFNGRFVRSRDFEKGVFDGAAINIYEFEKEVDLKVTLIHEFGHALGLGHADDPNSIMHRKLAVQDLQNIRFSEEDLKMLRSRID